MSIIAIHQPQYLPWLPYFQKIAASDYFVYLDNVQFQRRGVQNRNTIKGPNGKITLTVPVISNRHDLISTVRIADIKWRAKHVKSIEQCYSKASHYDYFESLVKPIIMSDFELLVDLNISMLQMFIEFFGIDTKFIRASTLEATGVKEELIINICKELDGTVYLSGAGAADYQTKDSFNRCGLELVYHQSHTTTHEQCFGKTGFVPDLSALDAMLNVGPDTALLV